jgi:hypothetical protein
MENSMATPITVLPALGRDNAEVAVKSFGALSKGMQAIAAEIVEYNKSSFDRSINFARDLSGAANLNQAIDVQTSYWTSTCQSLASEISKLGEIWASIAQEAAKPLAETARETTRTLTEVAKETSRSATDTAKETARQTSESAKASHPH